MVGKESFQNFKQPSLRSSICTLHFQFEFSTKYWRNVFFCLVELIHILMVLSQLASLDASEKYQSGLDKLHTKEEYWSHLADRVFFSWVKTIKIDEAFEDINSKRMHQGCCLQDMIGSLQP